MFLNMNKPLAFIHIPKTAGTSIAKISNDIGVLVKGHDIRHSDFLHLSEYDPASLIKYHLFAIVRNPWDRVLSSFLYLNTGGRNNGDLADQKRYLERYHGDFNAFVRSAFTNDTVVEQLHFIPQYRWICNENEKVLVNTVLKFENLNREMDKFFKSLGKELIEIPKINTTNHKHYSEYYDNESIEIINQVYQKDITLFNYAFINSVNHDKSS